MVQLMGTFNIKRMHFGEVGPVGSMLGGGRNILVEKSVKDVKSRVQMQVMEHLGFLQKPASVDDLETRPMTGEEVEAAFERWEKFRFEPRFANLFFRFFRGYHDDTTDQNVGPMRDEVKLAETITIILREPPEVFQTPRYDAGPSHSGQHA